MSEGEVFYSVDFETFYSKQISVTTLGTKRYLEHPETDIYMVSMWGPGVEYAGSLEDAPWEKIQGHLWVAHNARFDMNVFRQAQEKGQVPKDITPSKWRDTTAISAYLQCKRTLEASAEVLLKEKADKRVRTMLCGKKWENLKDAAKERVTKYALEDARLCYLLYERFAHELPEWEWRLAELTIEQAERGVGMNMSLLEEGLAAITAHLETALDGLPWRYDRPIFSRAAIMDQCDLEGIPRPESTAEDNPAYQEWAAKHPVGFVKSIQEARTVNKTKKLLEGIKARTKDGVLDFDLKYHGATCTGRWAGAGGVNMQNLPKGTNYDVDVRKLLVPRPGNVFVVADLSQIEPRCLAWCIDDDDFLDYVRGGGDVYEAHARTTMGYDDPRPLKEVDSAMRQLAKARVLGLGYQLGAVRFREYAAGFGFDLSSEEAAEVVDDFRSMSPKLTAFWAKLGEAFTNASRSDHYLKLDLPSGRSMEYWDVRNETRDDPEGKSYSAIFATTERGSDTRRIFHGGKLVENVVQATARDAFGEGILNIESAGHKIIWHVHDEVIVECPEAQGDEVLKDVIRCLTQDIPWAKGLPLAADGFTCKHYTK